LFARSALVGITADDFASMVPMGRMGQAEEIAQTVVFSALMLPHHWTTFSDGGLVS